MPVGSIGVTLLAIDHSRMGLQSELTGPWQMTFQLCSLKQSCHFRFEEKHSLLKSKSGIALLHPFSRVSLPMRPGSSANLMSLIFVFGAALHMSLFRRTSAALFNPTWRLGFLLVIPLVTRAGSSTIPLQRNTSSLSGIVELPALVSRSEEHTSELQSLRHIVCRLLLEKKKNNAMRRDCARRGVPSSTTRRPARSASAAS